MFRFLYLLTMVGHICVQVVMGEGVFSFTCDPPDTRITITYVNGPGTTARFFFASGKQDSCSISTSSDVIITGDGVSSATAYTLIVNPTNNNDATHCGIQLDDAATETYSFSMEVKFGPDIMFNSVNDKVYPVTCSFKPATPSPTVVSQYACDSQKRIHFHYYDVMSTPPADIYSVDKRATCSMSGSSGTGAATPEDPFQLIIDVSGIQTPDCGAKEVSSDVYEVNILVQSTALILKAEDRIYRVRCNFSEVPTELSSLDTLSVQTNLKNGSLANLIGNASLRVTDEDGNAITQIQLGQTIILQADLITTDAAALHVSKCVARPARESTVEVSLLDDSGCATGDLISTFSSNSGLSSAKTQPFLAFRFDNSDTLVFICVVDFCYGTDVTKCTGNHCDDDRRRKRGILNGDEEKVSTFAVFSDYRSSEALGRNTSVSDDGATDDCNKRLYWTVLGCLLVIILLLLFLTCCALFRYMSFRKRKNQKL